MCFLGSNWAKKIRQMARRDFFHFLAKVVPTPLVYIEKIKKWGIWTVGAKFKIQNLIVSFYLISGIYHIFLLLQYSYTGYRTWYSLRLFFSNFHASPSITNVLRSFWCILSLFRPKLGAFRPTDVYYLAICYYYRIDTIWVLTDKIPRFFSLGTVSLD